MIEHLSTVNGSTGRLYNLKSDHLRILMPERGSFNEEFIYRGFMNHTIKGNTLWWVTNLGTKENPDLWYAADNRLRIIEVGENSTMLTADHEHEKTFIIGELNKILTLQNAMKIVSNIQMSGNDASMTTSNLPDAMEYLAERLFEITDWPDADVLIFDDEDHSNDHLLTQWILDRKGVTDCIKKITIKKRTISTK